MRTFLYGFTPDQIQWINDLLKRLDFGPATPIASEHGASTLEEILAGRPAAAGERAPEERLVLFHEFGDQDINRFLNGYSAPPLPQPIFAAVTEVNRTWTFNTLLAALRQERRELAAEQTEPADVFPE